MSRVITRHACSADLQKTLDGSVSQSLNGGMVLSGLIKVCTDMPSSQAETAWNLYEHALRLGLTVQTSAQEVLWNVQTGTHLTEASREHVLPGRSAHLVPASPALHCLMQHTAAHDTSHIQTRMQLQGKASAAS